MMQARRRLLFGLVPLCLFVAGYCLVAGLAPGGWHTNREGEPSYTTPVRHSREFYTGLRWSVMGIGAIMAITSYCWGYRALSIVFGTAAILFNPLFTVHMSKQIWTLIDILAFWVFFIGPGYLWPRTDGTVRSVDTFKA